MKKIGKWRKKLAEEIMELLEKLQEGIDFEAGAEVELVPKLVLKLYAKLHILFKSSKKDEKEGNTNENREKGDKRLCNNDEGAFK